MHKLLKILIHIALYILDSFDKSKYELDSTGKIVNSFALKNVKVLTDTGWKDAGFLHETRKFKIWTIKTKNHTLHCADLHKVFISDLQEVFCDELKLGDKIFTENGLEDIVEIKQSIFSQNMCDLTVMDDNSRYYTNGILSHNTTTSALFMLHYILFNVDKNALVLGNKRKTAVEILDKAKKIFLELPYFLRPGIYKWNEGEIVLDNGCRLMAEATTINSGISFTFHCVLADEFAHIQPNIMDKFYNNLFPTITAGKARFMITSTQNGYNLFYRLCKAAEAHENEYWFFKTDWDEVPEWNPEKQCWEERDEEWHRMQVANYGSEEAFNAQFGTNFDVNANTLIDTKILRKFEKAGVEFVRKELPGVSFAEHFFFHPDYDLSAMKKDFFVITTDISEGVAGDDTVYIFNKLCFNYETKLVYTEAIGYFKYNKVNAQQATTILKEFCSNYMDINRYLVSLEYNLYGELFAKYIMENIERDPQNVGRFNEDIIMKYWNEEMTKFTLGKKITSKTKQLGTSLFKQAYERQEIINEALQFIAQVSNFCDTKGNGTYAASFGHDDMVMAQLQMVFVFDNPQYKSLCQMYIATLNNPDLDMNSGYDPYADMNSFQQQMMRGDFLMDPMQDDMYNQMNIYAQPNPYMMQMSPGELQQSGMMLDPYSMTGIPSNPYDFGQQYGPQAVQNENLARLRRM